jgi:hypothetical protein
VLVSSKRESMDMIVAEVLDLEKSGVVDASVSRSPESGMHAVPIGDGVAKSGVLTPAPGAFVAREFFCFSCHISCCLLSV